MLFHYNDETRCWVSNKVYVHLLAAFHQGSTADGDRLHAEFEASDGVLRATPL